MKIDFGLIVTAVNNAAAGLQGAKKGVEELGYAADHTEGRLRAIQVVLASIGTAKVIELGKHFLDTAGDVEQLRLKLGFVIGSMADAGRIIEDLQHRFGGVGIDDFAERLAKVFISLSATGQPIEQTKKLVDAIAQISVVSGRTSQDVETAGLVFTKLLEKGEVDIRSLVQQLTSAIPEAVNVMAAAAKKDVQTFVSEVKDGTVTSEEAIRFFLEGTNARFANATNLWKGTVKGATASIKEAWIDAIATLSNRAPINESIVVRLQAIRHEIDHLVEKITIDQIERFFNALDNVGRAAYVVIQSMAPLAVIVAKFGETIAKTLAVLPPEALTVGFIGYLVFGRLGGAAITLAVAGIDKFFGDATVKSENFMKFVENALPLGILGLLLGGPKGAAIAVGAIAALDYVVTKVAVLMEKAGVFGKSTEIQDFVKGGGTAFSGLLDGLTGKLNKVDDAATRTGNAFKTMLTPPIDPTGTSKLAQDYIDAAREQKLFIEGLGRLDPSLNLSGTNVTAYGAVIAHLPVLLRTAGVDTDALKEKAKALDERVKESSTTFTMNATAMDAAAIAAYKLKAPLGDITQTPVYLRQQAEAWEKIKGPLTGVIDSFNIYAAKVKGADLQISVGEINKKYDEQLAKLRLLQPELEKYVAKYKNDENAKAVLASINTLLERGVGLRGEEITKATLMDAIHQRLLQNEQRILQVRAQQAAVNLQQNFNNNPLVNLGLGTPGGQIVAEVEQQRLQLLQNILNYEQQIDQLRQKLLNTDNPALIAQINTTIDSYTKLKDKTAAAVEGLSASAVAQNQLWKDVGRSIFDGASSAIVGLITRTQTLQQVTMTMYTAITKAAADYILKLIAMNLFGDAIKGGSGGGMLGSFFGSIPKFFGGSAMGDAFPMGVRPFAQGGIISGPTLFGLAGEAGPEAIMPLERVGGKLGVRSSGGRGDTHYHISAIDTQSAIEFLLKNMDTISAGLQHRSRLNMTGRQV